MNKLGIKLILFITVLACIGPFFIKDKNGQPLLTLNKVKMPKLSTPEIPSIKDSIIPVTGKEELAPGSIVPTSGQAVVKMYTYKDAKGVNHFTDQKPQGSYKVLYLPMSMRKTDTGSDASENKKNRHESSKDKSSKSSSSSGSKDDEENTAVGIYANSIKKGLKSGSSGSSKSGDEPLPNPYADPGKLIEDAKIARKQIEENYKNQKKTMDDANR